MKGIAAFDIGTTAVKAVLVAESGEPLRSLSRDIPTLTSGDFREQDPRVWWEAFLDLLADGDLRHRHERPDAGRDPRG